MDCTTLRWSWNKYCLLYHVASLSTDQAALQATLHCALEPDLRLTFADEAQWQQWVTGLQAALQLVAGAQPEGPVPVTASSQPAAAVAHHTAPAPCLELGQLPSPPGVLLELQPAKTAAAHLQPVPCSSLQSATGVLQHHLVRAALCSQHSLQQQWAARQAGLALTPPGCLPRFLHTSR